MPPFIDLRTRLLAALGQPEARLSRAEQLADRGAAVDAVRGIAAAARAGLPQAQTQLGLCYLRGQGVPQNQAEARHWLTLAAGAGDPTALTELAAMALRGAAGLSGRGIFADRTAGAEPDPALAADLARRAADAGSAEAQALLAFILKASPEMAAAPGEADALYASSAQAGWPLGQLGHAMALIAAGASAEARPLLTAAAETGLPTAHFLLGALAEAEGTLPAALDHYRFAAEHGHTGGKMRLGLALLSGRGGPRNPVQAETWLRRAAIDGDAIAAAVLGDFHTTQTDPNPEEAARWYRRAAERGHAGSALALTRLIGAGAEGNPDPSEWLFWLQQAIELGEPLAWPDLTAFVMASPPRLEDMEPCHAWLRRMAAAGHGQAAFTLGLCLNCGAGVPADEKKARRQYLLAASMGLIEGMAAAAEMLANGRGGPPEPELARALFTFAAKRDHAGATFALGVLSNDPNSPHFQRAAALGHTRGDRQAA